ncbi:MAG TPA: hypothetical protein VN258_16200 [Mobilitalea sp.]|nr:hypothetical protein [Mobilitalea sp.]
MNNIRKIINLGLFILLVSAFVNFGFKSIAYGATCSHTPTIETKAATCTSGGYTKVYCSKCGFVISYSKTSALGHLPATVDSKEATCTSGGYTKAYCSRCGFAYSYTTTSALGHLLVTDTKAASCTEGGYSKIYCPRCGYVSSYNTTSALDHNLVNEVTNDYTRTYCTRCSYESITPIIKTFSNKQTPSHV